jgi:hypothetical protein
MLVDVTPGDPVAIPLGQVGTEDPPEVTELVRTAEPSPAADVELAAVVAIAAPPPVQAATNRDKERAATAKNASCPLLCFQRTAGLIDASRDPSVFLNLCIPPPDLFVCPSQCLTIDPRSSLS